MNNLRNLNDSEKELITCMLGDSYKFDLEIMQVYDMDDGGMGSIRFVNDNGKMFKCIAEKQFYDEDGIPILVSININFENKLYELDIWKADFTKVIRYPKC